MKWSLIRDRMLHPIQMKWVRELAKKNTGFLRERSAVGKSIVTITVPDGPEIQQVMKKLGSDVLEMDANASSMLPSLSDGEKPTTTVILVGKAAERFLREAAHEVRQVGNYAESLAHRVSGYTRH